MNQSLLAQLRTFRDHPHEAKLAAAIGGVVPCFGFALLHMSVHTDGEWHVFTPQTPIALACLLFSVSTVWAWAYKTSKEPNELLRQLKAAAYVVSIEGTMVVAPHVALSAVALAYLVLINAVATACTLLAEDALPEKPTVTSVSRELSLPRRAAAKVLDQQLAKARPT